MSSPIIQAIDIAKNYGAQRALDAVSLSVSAGEFVALVGPSGCGKTTLLKIIAGFESPTRGRLEIEGRDMRDIPAAHRPTRMVFQKLALFPHKSVGDNIGFSLKLAGTPREEIRRRVDDMLRMMQLKDSYCDRLPSQLSGGEQQRVALARALISSPSVLLLDEPMSALDAKLKKSLQAELKRLHRSVGTSFVHVTHDLEEAMMLADRICVMRSGRVLQVGTPSEIYYRPADTFVAGFIGETNFFPVAAAVDAAGTRVGAPFLGGARPALGRDRCVDDLAAGNAVLMVRPERIGLHLSEPAGADFALSGRVEEYFIKGASIQYRIAVDGLAAPVVVEVPSAAQPPAAHGQPVRLSFQAADAFLMRE